MIGRFVILLLLCISTHAAVKYVAPNATGVGTIGDPGSLTVALSNGLSIAAGDLVYLRGGTYTNGTNRCFVSFSGSAGNFVTWRNYPGEQPKVDFPIWFQGRDYHRFWGIEFYDSHKFLRPGSVGYFDSTTSTNLEWINCIIHDVPAVWTGGSAGALVRGCVVWFPGKEYNDHTMYPYCREFSGNIVGWCAAQPVQLGTPGIIVRSNIIFGTGITVGNNQKSSILITDGDDAVISDNRLYDTDIRGGGILVQGTGSTTLSVTNNIVSAANNAIKVQSSFASINLSGNTWFDVSLGATGYPFSRSVTNGGWIIDNNTYRAVNSLRFVDGVDVFVTFAQWKTSNPTFDAASTATTGNPPDSVTVMRNMDDGFRSHVAIYNWSLANNVTVNLAGVIQAGNTYYVRSAQDYNGPIVKSGVFDGANISLPMTNLSVATMQYLYPTNMGGLTMVQPTNTSPKFAVFVVFAGGTKASGMTFSGGTLK